MIQTEDITTAERREEQDFIEEIMKTKVMKENNKDEHFKNYSKKQNGTYDFN